MPERKRPLDELAVLGKELFEREVQPKLLAEDHGKFVALDIETGDYEIDADDYSAIIRLRARRPEGDQWLMRVGYRAPYRIGASR